MVKIKILEKGGKNMDELRDNILPDQNKPLFIVSDFHGVYDAMEVVEDRLEKKNRRIIILGDCMDRGNAGIRILSRIKELIESGENVIYLPGNHDDALYMKFRHFVELYRNNERELTEEMVTVFGGFLRASKYDVLARANGQIPTFNEIIDMTKTPDGLREFFELMIWHENQPLLKIETDYDGRKIALGHASFDMDMYEMDEPLTLRSKAMLDKRYEELISSNPESEEFGEVSKKHKKAFACLWYRNPDDDDSINLDGVVRLPDKSEADVIVVGHTPKQEEVEIIGENTTRTAIDVDGGTVECYLSGEGEMVKFEPFRDSLPKKIMVTSFVVVGKKGAYEKLGLMDEYKKSDDEPEVEEETKVYVPRRKIKKNADPEDGFGDK